MYKNLNLSRDDTYQGMSYFKIFYAGFALKFAVEK